MGTLLIGISVMILIYAFFLHITYHYFLGSGNSKSLHFKGFIKKLKESKSMDHLGKLQKQ
jgi:hypothetical protein